jgi:hypothetical protein
MKRLALLAIFLLGACEDRVHDDRAWFTYYSYEFEYYGHPE